MKHTNLKCIPILLLLGLTSCSKIYGTHGIIQNRDKDYLEATQISPLHIPPGLSSSKIEAHYPVSDADYPANRKEVKLLPPELASSKTSDTGTQKQDILQQEMLATEESEAHGLRAASTRKGLNGQLERDTAATKSQTPSTNSLLSELATPDAPLTPEQAASLAKPPLPKTPKTNEAGQAQTFKSPISKNEALTNKEQQQVDAHYYDAHTRSTTGGIGKSIKSVVSRFWPFGKKESHEDASNKTVTTTTPVSNAATSATPPVTNAPTTATSPITNAATTEATVTHSVTSGSPVNATKNQPASNVSSQSGAEPAKMPNMYFDRYTKR